MAWEIERRYLARVPKRFWSDVEAGRRLRQAYIVPGPLSVRIRTGEGRGPVLTCKSGTGVRRREVETVVPDDVAEALFEAAEDRVVEKVRHRLGPWELDRFLGPLDGLVLLEIELDGEDEPIPDPPEGVAMLREVTHDNRFVSSELASMFEDTQRELVQQVYRELAV